MTEDNKQKWLALFDVIKKIKELEPWNHFNDDTLFIYQRNSGKRAILNVLGSSSKPNGFVCYKDEESFFNFITCLNEYEEMASFMQNSYFVGFMDREDVGRQNLALIKELRFNFRGKGEWLTITARHERCVPSVPNISEIDELTDIFNDYYKILKTAIYSSKVYNIGEIQAVYAKKGKDGNWKIETGGFIPFIPEPKLDFDDKKRLKALKTVIPTQKEVYVEEFCNPYAKTDDAGNKYYLLDISFYDPDKGEMVYEQNFSYETSRACAFSTAIVNYIEKFGKPRKISMSNNFSAFAAAPICDGQGIKLEVEEWYTDVDDDFDEIEITEIDEDDEFDSIMRRLIAEREEEWKEEEAWASKKRKKSNNTYTVSVSLGTGCYRHIRISGDCTLEELHEAILDAFRFDNDHLYAFFMDNKVWSEEDSYHSPMDSRGRKTDRYYIADVLEEKQKFMYLFDFGDEWRFSCKVLKIEDGIQKNAEVVRSKGEAPSQYGGYDEW